MKFTIVNDSSHKLILLSIFSNALEYLHHKRNVTNLFAQKVGEAENPSKSRCILKLCIMKYLKMILPMMAMIFAIGLMFANPNVENDPNNDYVQLNDGTWFTIPEQDCGVGDAACEAQLAPGGDIYQVYDDMSTSFPKEGDGKLRRLYE